MEFRRPPARSDPALKRDVAALDCSGWFSRYQGCSRQKASFSLCISPLFLRLFHSTLDPVAVLSFHPFVSLHFGLLCRGGRAPRLVMEPRGAVGGVRSRAVVFGVGGGSLSPRSALRISLPLSGTWKRYGLRKSLQRGWGKGVRRVQGGLTGEAGEGEGDLEDLR